VSGEGLLALGLQRLLPVAEEVLAEAEGACRLGEGIALVGDELDRLGFELRGVVLLCHAQVVSRQNLVAFMAFGPRLVNMRPQRRDSSGKMPLFAAEAGSLTTLRDIRVSTGHSPGVPGSTQVRASPWLTQ
jgi:hypothetical protein